MNRIVLEGLAMLLEKEKEITVTHLAQNGQEVMMYLEREMVDIAILDVEMPLMDGIETTRKIRQLFPDVKVLILTMYNDKEFIIQLIQAGVSGYILKNRGKEELVQAIESIAGGGEYFGESVTRVLIDAVKEPEPKVDKRKIQLTKREIEILTLIGKGLSSPQISKMLFIATTTINTHRRNLIDKLQVSNSKALIIYAIENGFVDDDIKN